LKAITGTVMNGSFHTTLAAGQRWIRDGLPGSVVSTLTTWVWSGSAFVVPSEMAKGRRICHDHAAGRTGSSPPFGRTSPYSTSGFPTGSGIDVCRDVRSSTPEIRCLGLTSYDDNDALFAAVMAGAAGYLLKEIRCSSLVDAIRQVAAGRSLLDPAVTGRLMTRLREGAPQDQRLASLTAREREVLGLISDGLTNREIGERLFLAEKTVKNYVSELLAKLGMQRRTRAVYGADVRT